MRNLKEDALTAMIDNCAAIQAMIITVAKSYISREVDILFFLNWLSG
jgi:hypothetical protein